MCELWAVQLRPAVDVLVVPYSVRLTMGYVGEVFETVNLARNKVCSLRIIVRSKHVGAF